MGVKSGSNLEALFSSWATSQQTSEAAGKEASVKLQQLVNGFWPARALYTVAKLGIADLLYAGVQRSDELALATDTQAPALDQLLRALTSVGLFTEETRGCFALTPLSHKLRSDVPDSLRLFILTELEEVSYEIKADPIHNRKTVRALREPYSSPPLATMQPRFCRVSSFCSDRLGSVAARVHAAVLDAYDFSTAGTLVDVGGGDGAFLAFLLQSDARLQGIVVEQPPSLERARARLAMEGVGHRCKVIAGDFFEFLPRRGSTYILKGIISDYADEQALQILTTCCRAMPRTGKLLLIDAVAVDHSSPAFPQQSAARWTARLMKRTRTVEEFRVLLQRAGLRLKRLLPACSEASIIEATPERWRGEQEGSDSL